MLTSSDGHEKEYEHLFEGAKSLLPVCDQAQKELFAPSFCAFTAPHSRWELPQTLPVCGKVPERSYSENMAVPLLRVEVRGVTWGAAPRSLWQQAHPSLFRHSAGLAAKRTQFSRSQPEGSTDTRRLRPFAAARSRASAVVSAVAIGAMPTDGRVYPYTALVLTWFQLKRDRDSPFMACFLESASAARGSEAIIPGLQEDFPGDPAETDGSAKGRTAPI